MSSNLVFLQGQRFDDFQQFKLTYQDYLNKRGKPAEIDGVSYPLFPGFFDWNKENYESHYNYDLLLEEAQRQSGIEADGIADGLRKKGYQVIQAMTPEDAGKWCAVIQKETSTKHNQRKFKVTSREISRRNETLLAFAEDLITEELEHLVEQSFQSNFYIMFLHFNRVIPFDHAEETENISFKWHNDGDTPQHYVKFLFMLNGFDEHEGGTSFLDKETTARLGEAGYTYCPVNFRVEDIAPLCRHYDIPFEPDFIKPDAGQGVLFQPLNVLHKGMAPAKGPRVGGQIAFIPHPRPWRETFKKNLQRIREMTDVAFPRVLPLDRATPEELAAGYIPIGEITEMPSNDETNVTPEPQDAPNGAPEKPFQVEIRKERNPMWKEFNEKNVLTLEPLDYLRQDSKVFSMGSCFAVEIRTALMDAGLDVYPKYREMEIDHSRHIIGALPERDNINHYHTFAIRQEFEKYHGIWKQEEKDYWEVPDHWWKTQKTIYQDPYRRSIFGKSPKHLMDAVSYLDEVIWGGMEAADVFLITLGLIEVWRKKDNGFFSCEFPGYNLGGGHNETEFHLSTFQENYENMKETVKLIRKINAKAEIVFTVSPVWLGMTFTKNDVYVANMESKSQLRAVAGQVCREEKNVHYFPSFEIATALHGKGHSEDGRHVRDETVFNITSAFMLAHSNGKVKRQPPKADEPKAAE